MAWALLARVVNISGLSKHEGLFTKGRDAGRYRIAAHGSPTWRRGYHGMVVLYQFQIKDEIKAARIEATQAYRQYIEEPKTSQRR